MKKYSGEFLGIRSNNDNGVCLNCSRAHFAWVLYGSTWQIPENIDIKESNFSTQSKAYETWNTFVMVIF